MNKTTEIKIRVTPTEKKSWLIKAQKAGISLSEYLRRCASRREIPAQPPEVNYHLVLQLGRISNSLNQQVLAMNAAVTSGQDISNIAEATEAVAQVLDLLKTVQSQLLNPPESLHEK